MPYYCTVPRCTSMAGKDKNVSFHQFPRDEELADLWNNVLKRGKPYTKYSKVCSLHFKPEDYTITSVGKNKGQWRTLRKDAVPTQNLPSDSPITPQRSRSSTQWQTPTTANIIDPRIHQQVAQAIYMQTMLAMQAAGVSDPATLVSGFNGTSQSSSDSQPTSTQILPLDITELQRVLQKHQQIASQQRDDPNDPKDNTFQCQECSKCFKDPDVFQLHKRIHKVKHEPNNGNEKENVNNDGRLATLKANPILFNLLKAGVPNGSAEEETSNVMSIENQMITALSANMENYLRNLSTMLTNTENNDEISNDAEPVCDKKDLNESMDSNNLVIDESV